MVVFTGEIVAVGVPTAIVAEPFSGWVQLGVPLDTIFTKEYLLPDVKIGVVTVATPVVAFKIMG